VADALPTLRRTSGFVPLVLLGAFAMFILPHQFHVAVVEAATNATCAPRAGCFRSTWC
jgi:hypothetical protein